MKRVVQIRPALVAAPAAQRQPLLRGLPRRMPLRAKGAAHSSPQLKLSTVEAKAPLGWLVRRSSRWFLAGLQYSVNVLWDRLRGRWSPRDRARRVRQVFESAGGFAIKMGGSLLSAWTCSVTKSAMSFRGSPPMPLPWTSAMSRSAWNSRRRSPSRRSSRCSIPNPLLPG